MCFVLLCFSCLFVLFCFYDCYQLGVGIFCSTHPGYIGNNKERPENYLSVIQVLTSLATLAASFHLTEFFYVCGIISRVCIHI